MTRLAALHQAVNLGQGFPNFDGPVEVKQAASTAISEGKNQYARSHGVPELNQAIALHQQRFYGQNYDAETEITVHSGATEAICAALLALCEPGDEVLMFEPFYESYRACVAMAQGVPRAITLKVGADESGFSYTDAELAAAITSKARVLLLNTPHNPTGKVFSEAELARIAELCVKHDLIAITDEVYEHLVYEGSHLNLAAFPGMSERTIRVSSAGKTFSFTGWKIGWSCAPKEITAALRTAHQFITFSSATPFQHAVAEALALGDEYYTQLRADYLSKRDKLCRSLEALGLSVVRPAGSYFICADVRGLGFESGTEFCRLLPELVGVAAIPNAAFYLQPNASGGHLSAGGVAPLRGDEWVRFAFCKTDALLDEAARRLSAGLPALKQRVQEIGS